MESCLPTVLCVLCPVIIRLNSVLNEIHGNNNNNSNNNNNNNKRKKAFSCKTANLG